MLSLDSKRLAQDPMLKGTPKDWYLVELKGFEKKQNPQGKQSLPQTQLLPYVLPINILYT